MIALAALCSAAALFAPARAPSVPRAQVPEVAAESWSALSKEYELAVESWRKALADAPAEQRRALREHPPVLEYWPRFEAAAERGQGRALLWLATHLVEKGVGTRELLPETRRLYAELFEKHVSEVWFGAVLDELPGEAHHLEPGKLRAYYLAAIEKNPFPEVRAQAMYELGKLLYASEDPRELAEGHDWLQKASEVRDTRFGNAALTLITMPVVGQPAPDFSGRTIEGRAFRLSDFRGQVVLVDFYGFWCGYCMKAMPHLRELAKQHADEPFAVIGVDANDDEETYRRGLASHGITWTSAYQGPETAISRLYRVNVYPAYFLIDADGTLVKATRSLEELDGPIAELIAKRKAIAPKPRDGG